MREKKEKDHWSDEDIETGVTSDNSDEQQPSIATAVASSSTVNHIVITVEELDLAMCQIHHSASDAEEDDIDNEENEEETEVTEDKTECRFCQEEDFISDMEAPCLCSGTMKYAHRECVERWCKAKGNIICEICCEPYSPDYTVGDDTADETVIDISDGWRIPGTNRRIGTLTEIATGVNDRITAALDSDWGCLNFIPERDIAFCESGLTIFLFYYFMVLVLLAGVYFYTAIRHPESIDPPQYCPICNSFSFSS